MQKSLWNTLCVAALSLGALAPAAAYDLNSNGTIAWKYYNGTSQGDSISNRSYSDGGLIPSGAMSGSSYYSNTFNTSAQPLTAPTTLNVLESQISYTLQEKRHIDKSNIVLTNDDQTNIKIAAGTTAKVWVTFMNEGAGFENSVGFFTYDLNSVPVRNSDGSNNLHTEQILFPRASTSYPLPKSTTSGTTVYLGSFSGGANGLGIGFLVVANGWSGTGRSTSPATPGVKSTQDKSWIYYSLKALNPECVGVSGTCNLDQHTVLLNDGLVTGTDNTVYRRMVLGIEDYKRSDAGCDHDFNDVLLAVHVTPDAAISNLSSLPQLIASTDPDTDLDGVKDSADEFPNDITKAYSRYYPGSSTWGTLAFEDLWPSLGDYDLNDVVIRYQSREILNAARAVTALEMNLRLDARGGGLRSGFALNLPGISASNVSSATLTQDGVAVSSYAVLPSVTGGGSGAVFEIFPDATNLMPDDNDSACAFGGYNNTAQGCPVRPFIAYKLTVNFTAPVTTSFPAPPYDPFIFSSNSVLTPIAKGIEVHLPGKQPTSRAATALFGTHDDRSVLGGNNTYKSSIGLPWALDIPTEWAYPYEFLDVVNAYPNIVSWAVSGGVNNKNWYELAPAGVSKTFRNGR